jgi:hypothetical protein
VFLTGVFTGGSVRGRRRGVGGVERTPGG